MRGHAKDGRHFVEDGDALIIRVVKSAARCASRRPPQLIPVSRSEAAKGTRRHSVTAPRCGIVCDEVWRTRQLIARRTGRAGISAARVSRALLEPGPPPVSVRVWDSTETASSCHSSVGPVPTATAIRPSCPRAGSSCPHVRRWTVAGTADRANALQFAGAPRVTGTAAQSR